MFGNARWFTYETLYSTNSKAQELILADELPEGSVIMAAFQQNGRGQRGNTWHSQAGQNILMSTVLYPCFLPTDQLFMLNKIIALAVSDLVEAMGVANVRIKWPNDVYCGNKKLAGILIENTFRASDLVSTIVGTGINVNQMEFITELKNVSSVQLETGQPYSIQKTAESLHLQIAYWYEQLQQKNVDLINTSYHQRLFRLALPFFYRKGSTKFTGTIKGVSNTGKLIMTSESGETLSFDLKEVEFII